jgi:predicted DNA-binding transcriptional regulator
MPSELENDILRSGPSFYDVLSSLPRSDRMVYDLAVAMGQGVRAREIVWDWWLDNVGKGFPV